MDREERRNQILEVAKVVFAEKGYHDARIDDIVARARVARGTFYLYFEDKRSIFSELVDGFVERLTGSIVAVEIHDNARSPVAQLSDNVRRVIELFLGDPSMAKILLSDAVGLDPEFDQKLLACYSSLTELIQLSLIEGEGAGLVKPGDARVRAFCLVGIVKELLYQTLMRKTEISIDRMVATVMALLVDGLLTESSRRP